jgi:coenzyme F420-dependent glucose-6-phosphate dehydrogenase
MNEAPLGFDWPRAKARITRTKEAIQIIRKLWHRKVDESRAGANPNSDHDKDGFVNFNGEYFLIRGARLYTPPITQIPIYMAATGMHATKIAAKYSDGLISYLPPSEAAEIIQRFENEAKKVGREPNNMERLAEFKISFSDDYDAAFKSAAVWRPTLIKNVFDSDISDPRKLQHKADREVSDEQIKQSIHITTSIEDCIKPIQEYFKVGFTRVYIHSTSPDEIEFIRQFRKRVMPNLETDVRVANTSAEAA